MASLPLRVRGTGCQREPSRWHLFQNAGFGAGLLPGCLPAPFHAAVQGIPGMKICVIILLKKYIRVQPKGDEIRMKKILSAFLTVTLILLSLSVSQAAPVFIRQGVNAVFPSGYTVLYDGMSPAELDAVGYTAEDVLEMLDAGGCVAEAYDRDLTRVIDIVQIRDENRSLTALGESSATRIADAVKEMLEDLGYRIDRVSSDRVNHVLYLIFYGTSMMNRPFIRYYAVEDYKAWSFILTALDSDGLSSADEKMIRDFVDQLEIVGVSSKQ